MLYQEGSTYNQIFSKSISTWIQLLPVKIVLSAPKGSLKMYNLTTSALAKGDWFKLVQVKSEFSLGEKKISPWTISEVSYLSWSQYSKHITLDNTKIYVSPAEFPSAKGKIKIKLLKEVELRTQKPSRACVYKYAYVCAWEIARETDVIFSKFLYHSSQRSFLPLSFLVCEHINHLLVSCLLEMGFCHFYQNDT